MIQYILRSFILILKELITHSHSEVGFLRPIRVIGYFEEGALVWRGDFWQFMVFFLKEGLQLGFACYFLDDL
jgi:hypothetical protein